MAGPKKDLEPLDSMDKARALNRRIKKKGRFLGGSHGSLLGQQSAPVVVFSGIPRNGAVRAKAGIGKHAQDLGQVPRQCSVPVGLQRSDRGVGKLANCPVKSLWPNHFAVCHPENRLAKCPGRGLNDTRVPGDAREPK
jgi:hypothetical protein